MVRMVDVFREAKRVLRPHGTLWLNLGDTYSQDTKWGGKSGQKNYTSVAGGYQTCRNLRTNSGLKAKDLVGIPWRVALALQADGWYLRSDIIWHKPNPMPESVTDRPTKSHEYIFLLSKSEHYYYDADAIREPHKDESLERWKPGSTWDGERVRGYPSGAKHSMVPEQMCHPLGRNKRTVWTVATQPFPGTHFATFPPKLIEPCILAGTNSMVCPACGAPWERVRESTGHVNRREVAHVPNHDRTRTDSTGWAPTSRGTDEFSPACKCPNNDGSETGVVLDPFGGSGTTSLVAARLGRNSVYIDLNPEYLRMAAGRLRQETEQLNLFTEHRIEVMDHDYQILRRANHE